MTKYGNHKTIVDGITFDSQKEANRYCELRLLQKAGQIKNLELQKKIVLIPAQYEFFTDKKGNRKGKCIEREWSYIADFVYEENGQTVVEDVKGYKTKEYIAKRKATLFLLGIRIREI